MIEYLFSALTPLNILLALIGVAAGTIIGSIPGLRDVTGRGSTRDAAGIRRRDEVTQVSERVVYY